MNLQSIQTALNQGDWKLVHYHGDFLGTAGCTPGHQELYGKLILGPRTELYQLGDDPGETTNLAAANPARTAGLKRALDKFLADTRAALPRKNPTFDPGNSSWWKNVSALQE